MSFIKKIYKRRITVFLATTIVVRTADVIFEALPQNSGDDYAVFALQGADLSWHLFHNGQRIDTETALVLGFE